MDVSDIFTFCCSAEGKGESGATRRGGSVFLLTENPGGGGGGSPRKGGGGGGWEGVCGELGFFFRGRNPHHAIDAAFPRTVA